jgi:hypothetical protein
LHKILIAGNKDFGLAKSGWLYKLLYVSLNLVFNKILNNFILYLSFSLSLDVDKFLINSLNLDCIRI